MNSLRSYLALVLSALLMVTSAGVGAARGTAPAVDAVVICAGHGVTVLLVDADGNPARKVRLCPDAASALLLHAKAPNPLTGSGAFRLAQYLLPPDTAGLAAHAMPTVHARAPPHDPS